MRNQDWNVALHVLKKVEDIAFCELTNKDVVRHPLVQKIVQAYDAYEKKKQTKKEKRSLAKTGGKNDDTEFGNGI